MARVLTEQLQSRTAPAAPDVAAPERRLARQRRVRAYRIVDGSLLLLATIVAVLASPAPHTVGNFAWGIAYALLSLVILQGRGFYSFRLQEAPVDTVARIFAATSIAAMVLTAVRALLIDDPMLTSQSVRLWAFALVFLGAGRVGITLDRRQALRRGEIGFNTLIVGAGRIGNRIAERLRERPELGLRPIGFLDKDPLIDHTSDGNGLPVLGASWDLEQTIHRHDVEQVVVTFSTAPHEVMLDLIRRCRSLGVEVAVIPRLFEEVNNRVEVEHLGGIPMLRAASVDPKGWQFSIKYAIDRIVASVALLVLAPVLGLLALAVRLSSPGPILYRQPRVGLDGQEFDMLKFRTMRGDGAKDGEADAAWAASATGGSVADGQPAAQTPDRRTRVGRVLRKLSLDELPQLINVLRGEMSLVGPRPERTRYVRAFEEHVYRYSDRHRVKSGLTGWAQVQGLRGQTSLADRVEWDNYYIENWSLWLDLKIVLLTVPALFGAASAE